MHPLIRRARAQTFGFYEEVDEYLGLPEDREEWDAEDYEDERHAVAGYISRLHARLGAYQHQQFGARRIQAQRAKAQRSQTQTQTLGRGLQLVQTPEARGMRTFALPLREAGLVVIARAPERMIRGLTQDTIEEAVAYALMDVFDGGADPWTSYL